MWTGKQAQAKLKSHRLLQGLRVEIKAESVFYSLLITFKQIKQNLFTSERKSIGMVSWTTDNKYYQSFPFQRKFAMGVVWSESHHSKDNMH